MIISNSNVSMQSEHNYSTQDVRQVISLTSKKGDEINPDFSGEKSLFEQFQDAANDAAKESDSSDHAGMSAMDAFLSLKRPSYSGDGMQNIRSLEELRMLLLEQMMTAIKDHSWHSLKEDSNAGMLSRDGDFECLKFDNSQNYQALAASVSLSGTYTIQTVSSHFYEEKEVTAFTSTGSVTTADGRQIDFGITFEMGRVFSTTDEAYEESTYQLCDPLVINYSGNPAELTDQYFAFDLDSDGEAENLKALAEGSGLLALDRNADGTINDGSELFGTESGDGFEDLAAYDSDGNGWIDEADDIFSQLRILVKNSDGTEELLSLKEVGIGAIGLDNVRTQFSMKEAESNRTEAVIQKSGVFLYEEGSVGTIQQMDYAV